MSVTKIQSSTDYQASMKVIQMLSSHNIGKDPSTNDAQMQSDLSLLTSERDAAAKYKATDSTAAAIYSLTSDSINFIQSRQAQAGQKVASAVNDCMKRYRPDPSSEQYCKVDYANALNQDGFDTSYMAGFTDSDRNRMAETNSQVQQLVNAVLPSPPPPPSTPPESFFKRWFGWL